MKSKELDLALTLSRQEMKEYGIFFTPEDIVNKYMNLNNLINILEPSCGNGVFIDKLISFSLTAYELNDKVYSSIENKYKKHKNITIYHEDYLKSSTNDKYDLIIGNPPYFVTKNKQYKEYYTGRPNIFIQFIIHSLLKLNDDGILCFVIPTTFLNCQYYSKTREYIKTNYEILDIYINPSSFKTTNYETLTILIRKRTQQFNNNNKWFYNDVILLNKSTDDIYDTDNYYTIKQLMETDKTLTASIGSFVWNQHKEQLKDININNNTNSYPVLIYKPNDTVKRSLVINAKPEDIIKSNHQPVIIINRGCGNSKYKFNYELINPLDYPNGFILENHLLVIKSNNISTLQQIINSFNNQQTKDFINSYITNGAMNLNDLINNIKLFDENVISFNN